MEEAAISRHSFPASPTFEFSVRYSTCLGVVGEMLLTGSSTTTPDARDPELEITLLSIRRAKPGLSVTGASGVGGMLQCSSSCKHLPISRQETAIPIFTFSSSVMPYSESATHSANGSTKHTIFSAMFTDSAPK